jgi:predicted PurR-regulated permease PerM
MTQPQNQITPNGQPDAGAARGEITALTVPLDAGRDPREWRGGLKRFGSRWLALLAATILSLYVCWLMLQPLVDVLLWATVLTIIFYPVRNFFVRRLHNPAWAAAASCLFVVAVIVIPISAVATAVIAEADAAATYLQQNASHLLSRETPAFRFLSRYIVDLDRLGWRDWLIYQLQNFGGDIAGKLPAIVGVVVVRVLEVIFVILTMYYLFRDGDRVQSALLDALPLERNQSQRIFLRTREVIGASVYGVLAIATIQAVLGGLAFWVLGLPEPLLWSVVLFFLSMIPMAGSFIVWVPAALYLALTDHWVKAIVLSLWCMGVVGMIDNVLRPRFVGKRTRLHELLIFFSVLGGLQVFGVVGLVMGPVVVAITLALVDVFRKSDRPVGSDEPTLIEQQAALRNVPMEGDLSDATFPVDEHPVAVSAVEPSPATPTAPVTVTGPRLGETPAAVTPGEASAGSGDVAVIGSVSLSDSRAG